MFELFVESGNFRSSQIAGSRETLLQNTLGWSHLSPPAFANNDTKHFPNIFLRFEKFLAFALADDTADESPTDQVAQITVGVSPADIQLLHHVVRAQGSRGGNQKSMNLGHGSIDSPGATDHAPLADKFVPGLLEGDRCCVLFLHVFSINIENTEIKSFVLAGATPHNATGNSLQLFFRDLTAPAQNFCFCPCGFRFLDVAGTIVKQREACPADLVVRPQCYRPLAGFDRFLESPELHQRHSKGMPAIEKIRIKLYAPPVLLDRAVQIADGNVAAGLVKNLVGTLLRHSSSFSPLPSIPRPRLPRTTTTARTI